MNYIIGIVVLLVVYFLWRNYFSNQPYDSIRGTEAQELLRKPNVVALDVRTPSEIKSGQVKGAIHLNVMDSKFTEGLNQLEQDKTYVVYCRSGMRSARACRIMAAKGFTNLYNLSGGYQSL